MTGRSRVKTSGETSLNGDIAPLVPTTASELKKFEPIMLPSVNSFCPRRAEAMADASGILSVSCCECFLTDKKNQIGKECGKPDDSTGTGDST